VQCRVKIFFASPSGLAPWSRTPQLELHYNPTSIPSSAIEGPKTITWAVPLVMERVRTRERLKNALVAVSESTGFTLGALRSSYCSSSRGEAVHQGNNILMENEELALVYEAQAFSHTKFNLTRPRLASLALDQCNKEVGEIWARSWVMHHQEQLSSRTASALFDKCNSS